MGNVSALGGINTQALQAANLSGLLGNGLGGTDLSSLVQNPLATQSQATPFGGLGQSSSNLGSSNGISSFGRGGNESSGYGSLGHQGGGDGRFQNTSFGGNSSGDRLAGFSGSATSMMRPSMEGKSFSRKVIISNVSISFKMYFVFFFLP